jgi:shikimate dehydrogenase
MGDLERERVLLLGDPVGHSLSPRFQNAGFTAAGVRARYEARRVAPPDLEGAVREIREDRRILGANVTIPHKLAIVSLLDELAPEAAALRTVNTISRQGDRLIGSNTDVAGFQRALSEALDLSDDPPPALAEGRGGGPGSALILGAGGAARAVAYVLSSQRMQLFIASRDLDVGRRLVRELHLEQARATPIGSLALVVPAVKLIVNATPVGLDGKSLLFPAEWLTPRHFVFDLLYSPPLTPLVEAAREHGAKAVTGLDMLLYQGAASFEIWTGKPAPEIAMRRALEQAVGRP